MNLEAVERELKRRWAYPYRWPSVQGDRRDRATDFIYRVSRFDELLRQVQDRFGANPDYPDWFDYALNRWYNFWSARAVEEIFCTLERVTPAKNRRDRLVDFSIDGVRFDHKTTVFPSGFGHDLTYARKHPWLLIEWLYQHQSQQRRKHLANRLFVVLHAHDGQHWRLKAEIAWLKGLIETYIEGFTAKTPYRFGFQPDQVTLSDVIWGIKGAAKVP